MRLQHRRIDRNLGPLHAIAAVLCRKCRLAGASAPASLPQHSRKRNAISFGTPEMTLTTDLPLRSKA